MRNLTRSIAIIIFLGLSIQPSLAQDQDAAKKIYDQQTEEYLGISAVGKLMSTKWKVAVDFGQAFEWSIKDKDLLRDADGKVVPFNSPIDALNFLNAKGWILVTASGDDEYFYAVMKRVK